MTPNRTKASARGRKPQRAPLTGGHRGGAFGPEGQTGEKGPAGRRGGEGSNFTGPTQPGQKSECYGYATFELCAPTARLGRAWRRGIGRGPRRRRNAWRPLCRWRWLGLFGRVGKQESGHQREGICHGGAGFAILGNRSRTHHGPSFVEQACFGKPCGRLPCLSREVLDASPDLGLGTFGYHGGRGTQVLADFGRELEGRGTGLVGAIPFQPRHVGDVVFRARYGYQRQKQSYRRRNSHANLVGLRMHQTQGRNLPAHRVT